LGDVQNKDIRPVYKRKTFFNISPQGVHFPSKFPKRTNRTQKRIFLEKMGTVPKNAEFYANFRSAGKIAKSMQKKFISTIVS